MKITIQFLALLSITTWFSIGCTKQCDFVNVDEINALRFEFKTSGDGSFSQEELDEAYMVRYLIAFGDSLTFPEDTVSLNGIASLKLTNNTPFVNDSLAFVRYNYTINFENNPDLIYVLTQIDIESKYVGECAYENMRKLFTLNNQAYNVTENDNPFIISK